MDDVVVSTTTLIRPSTRFTLSVISPPLVSLMKAFDQVTGYLPVAQSSGTLYVSTITFAPSSAAFPSPDLTANPNSLDLLFGTIVAL